MYSQLDPVNSHSEFAMKLLTSILSAMEFVMLIDL